MQSRTVGAAIGFVLASANADAAIVRDLRAIAAASATRVIVEVEGEYSWRTHSSQDGGVVYVDIEGAEVGDEVPRMLPVSDARVDGVIVESDGRRVRVAIDVAGKVAPALEADADGSRLILTFVDGIARAANGSRTLSAGTPSTDTGATLRRDPPLPPPGGSPGPASRDDVDRAARAAARERIAAMEARSGRSGPPPTRSDTEAGAGGNRATSARSGKSIAAQASGGEHEPGSVHAPAAASRRSVVERPVVVLDPGHGGKDPGAKAWTGEYEKDIVLDLADRIARRLRSSGAVEVVMTRSGDEYVALADRRDFSRRWDADAFVSIHANASHSGAARGFATYYHPRTTGAGKKGGDREARRLARLENGGKQVQSASGGARNRQRTGSATARRASLAPAAAPVLDRRSESMRLARLVQDELVRRLEMRYEAVRDLGAREGPFFVIGENAAPSVLVEAAFLTHREEGVRMRSEVYREQIADGVARGILAFLEHQRHSGTL